MKKKHYLFSILGIILILTTALLIYRTYFSQPEPFLSNKQIINNINYFLPGDPANKVQDVLQVDSHHFFVPFITKVGHYGTSYWVWKKHEWKIQYAANSGEPRLWQIDLKDPSTFCIVWSLNPIEEVSNIDFYLSQDRDYSINNGTEHYYSPKVQMKKRVEVNQKSYGILKLPNEWSTVIESVVKAKTEGQPSLFTEINLNQKMYFGWVPYDSSSKVATPGSKDDYAGYGYSNGNKNLEYVRYLNESELESE
ncbi:hypothetical protein [Fictibacillus barbaricus]|uniref:DUF2931 family protein n=1 Tax=Fictibacillus barbaricus TaxID=182136 RepID=A0ABU1TWX2_9BACL|nr:hypothetical protein [Fictibacillus barbaricus]MDR7071722.1 hypothetical protein [Fictibacillus barbaricus]